MKIVNVIGGLGNQMFQYAFALALQKVFPNETVKINTSCFNGYPLHNGFELDRIFKLNIPKATFADLLKTAYPWMHFRLWQIGRRILPARKSMFSDKALVMNQEIEDLISYSYFDGYWQKPHLIKKYKEYIIEKFEFPKISDEQNLHALEFITEKDTAFIHVRRGDYVNHKIFGGICSEDYYKRGIEKLKKEYGFSRFIIFSDDITWAKEALTQFLEECDYLFLDWNKKEKDYIDIDLMSRCSGALISNSTFSWWGAWLMKKGVVLCPTSWTNITGHHDDIYDPAWLKI